MATDNESRTMTTFGEIYQKILREREEKRMEEDLEKEVEQELKAKEKAEKEQVPLTKKEKQERKLQQLHEALSLIGDDDLEYISPKKKKNRFKQWITDDDEVIGLKTDKPKKPKKVNYRKDFENELNMLKNILAEQNRFNDDLSRRWKIWAGNVSKDMQPLNKTQVEFAAAINSSRTNSLNLIKEIGNLKKTVADLELKKRKMDSDGGNEASNDLGLLGSSTMRNVLYGAPPVSPYPPIPHGGEIDPSRVPNNFNPFAGSFEESNPDDISFEGVDISSSIINEKIPKKTVVMYNPDSGDYNYRTYNTETGADIQDFDEPTYPVRSFNVKDGVAIDQYGTTFELQTM